MHLCCNIVFLSPLSAQTRNHTATEEEAIQRRVPCLLQILVGMLHRQLNISGGRCCTCSLRPTQAQHSQRRRALQPLRATEVGLEKGDDGQARSPVPPTVADTKAKFYKTFQTPIPSIYNNVIQELLVQQHLMRYNRKYKYDQVFALGFVSVFDQVLDGIPVNMADAKTKVFESYVQSLDEEPAQYRQDTEKMEAWAKELSSPSDLTPSSDGTELQKCLAGIAQHAKDGDFLYTRFFAIGLFRLLELTKAKDPKALEALVKSMNVSIESVNRDLTTYKGVLSKLNAAKEMMREFVTREKRKQAEREAEKAEAAKKAEAKKSDEEKEMDKAKKAEQEGKPATDVLKA